MSHGLAIGVTMTDDEVLRFYNMVRCATLPGEMYHMATTAERARKLMGDALDELAHAGMVATVGYKGCAVIRPV